MSSPVNQGTNRTTFAEGAILTLTDLNAISVTAAQRAWDSPGYGRLLAFDLAASSYANVFRGAAMGLQNGVFTIGGGAVATVSATPLHSFINDGYIGLWDQSRLGPPAADDTTSRMSWAWLTADDWAYTHDAAGSGNERYDLVHCAIVHSNLSTSRDFEDSTTGQKSSQVVNIAEQTAVDIQVLKGTESSGTPTIPSLPTGRHALYVVRASNTAITELHDLTIPYGAALSRCLL